MIEAIIKALGGLTAVFLGIALGWRFLGKREALSAPAGWLALLGVWLGLCASVAFYIQGQVGFRTTVPYAAGVACLMLLLISSYEGRGVLFIAALMALSPLSAFYVLPMRSQASGGILPLIYAIATALGCGLLLSEGLKGMREGEDAPSNLRRSYVALLFLLMGAMSIAWWDKLLLGLYWSPRLEGKGAVLELLLNSAAVGLHRINRRVALAGMAVLSLMGLWGLTLGYI